MWISQRTLYEARERQSKTYAWQAFVLSNIFIELAWNAAVAIPCFLIWYYPAGYFRNAQVTDSVAIRGFHAFLLVVAVFVFASTFAHFLIAAAPNESIASAIATLLGIMLYAFCGVLVGPNDMARFWIFMYRADPFTYLVSSFVSAALGQAEVHCAENEFQHFSPPQGKSCGEYMQEYITENGGYLRDAQATGECNFCKMDNTNQFLKSVNANWDTRWRDFGLLWVYIVFNIAATIFLYWVARVPKAKKAKKA